MDEIRTKVATIEKYLKRVSEDAREDWKTEQMSRESLLFNLDCLAKATVNCGSIIIQKKGMDRPVATKDVFDILQKWQVMDTEITNSLKKMTGFISLAAHDYNSLNIEILESLVSYDLHFFKDFSKATLKLHPSS